jgi:hypothetical protein
VNLEAVLSEVGVAPFDCYLAKVGHKRSASDCPVPEDRTRNSEEGKRFLSRIARHRVVGIGPGFFLSGLGLFALATHRF